MALDEFKQQKRSGKAEFSGRRRITTRSSGFHSHSKAAGNKYSFGKASVYNVSCSKPLEIQFQLPSIENSRFAGFGFYYRANNPIGIDSKKNLDRFVLSEYSYPAWNKVGYIWRKKPPSKVLLTFSALSEAETNIEIYDATCGEVWHEFFGSAIARENVMKNIHIYAPEALFYNQGGKVEFSLCEAKRRSNIPIKECNRCARLLPVNFDNERNALSFSNHKRFIKLKNINDHDQIKKLKHGFQLECRFCKKFAVNAALNPQRTPDQMSEDSQRRRHFELLLEEIYGESKQLNFKYKTGKELKTYIWKKFDKKCFRCKTKLVSANEMHLDHTRPLANLWALDKTATALCGNCNSSKRDRSPSGFYTKNELDALSKLTGIPISELKNPSPNIEALKLIIQRRDWLYSTFLNKDFLTKEKGGKITAELICKSLDRVLGLCDEKLTEESFVDGWRNYEFS